MSCGRFWTGPGSVWLVVWVAVACGHPTGLPVETVALREATAQDITAAVRSPGSKVVLVNMWATWCVPCRQEFPDLVKLEKKYRDRGLRVVFVSWDAEAGPARKFLAQQGVDFPSYLKTADQGDVKFIEAFAPQWSGAFPATMIYDATGQLRHFWEGKRAYADFEEKVREVLKTNQTGGRQ